MKTNLRKLARLGIVMTLIVMTVVSLFSVSVSAASWPSVSSLNYIEFTASKWMPVYRYSSCQTRGTSSPAKSYSSACIDAGDVCRIYKITSSYALVNYPAGSTRKTGYVRRSDIFGVSNPSENVVSQGKVSTARTAGGARSYGYIAKNDRVWKCGTSGSWTAVIYQAKSGSRAYKFGWIPTSEYNNGVKKTSAPAYNSSGLVSPVPAGCYFNRKTTDVGGGNWYGYHDINLNVSSNTPVYAIADGKVTFYQAYSWRYGEKYLTSYGNYIRFTSNDGKTTAVYAHLSGFNGVSQRIPSWKTWKKSGSAGTENLGTIQVKAGQCIGYIGSTGNSSNNHLHFELRVNGSRVDPTSKISGLTK